MSIATEKKLVNLTEKYTAMASSSTSLPIDNDSLQSRLKGIIPSENSVNALSGAGVNPSTIRKILEGKRLSDPTRKKVAGLLGRDPTPSSNSLSASKIPLRDKLKKLINNEADVLRAASKLGVGPSTIHKILSGTPVTRLVEKKIEIALENMGSSNDLSAGKSSVVDKLHDIYKMYQEKGTLEAVGKKIGLTKERVRQLLVKGTRIGLFEYKPRNYPYIPKEKLIDDYIDSLSLNEIARINHISSGYLRKLMTAYSITEKDLCAYGLAGRKKRCIQQYYKIVDKLGHHPSTTELQKPSESRSLWARISRLWGSFDTFRRELNIPQPPRVSPHWLEPRRQVAFIARMQHLDTIRECLSASNPMSVSEIGVTCGFNLNRVRRLLTLLMAASEVRRVGTFSSTKYMLATD